MKLSTLGMAKSNPGNLLRGSHPPKRKVRYTSAFDNCQSDGARPAQQNKCKGAGSFNKQFASTRPSRWPRGEAPYLLKTCTTIFSLEDSAPAGEKPPARRGRACSSTFRIDPPIHRDF